MRLVQAARLSKVTDAATSLDKQDADMRAWAERHGHDIIATAVDADVSGTVPPWERPGLGPWLTDPDRVAQYDGILASHLDRVGRSTLNYLGLLQRLKANGKTLITTALGEKIDFSEGVGELIGYVITWIGQEELAAIKRRTTDTARWLVANGYASTKAPFGYRLEPDASGHKILVQDPDKAPLLRQSVDYYLQDWTFNEIAGWLSKRVPPAQGGSQWNAETVSRMLRNPVLIGQATHEGKIVRGDDGLPLLRVDPLITHGKWSQIQEKMAVNSDKRTKYVRQESPMLSRVVECSVCGSHMQLTKSTVKRKSGTYTYRHYRCRNNTACRNKMINVEKAASIVEQCVKLYLGALVVAERRLVEGNDVAANIQRITTALADLEQDRYVHGLFNTSESVASYVRMHKGLEQQLHDLRQQKAVADHYETVPTGRTVADHWATLDDVEKGRALRAWGCKLVCYPDKSVNFSATIGDDYEEAAQALGVVLTKPEGWADVDKRVPEKISATWKG